MEHSNDCNWIKSNCSYIQTHHYCPHEEHACDCVKSKIGTVKAYAIFSKDGYGIPFDGMAMHKADKRILAIYPNPIDENQLDPFSVCLEVEIKPKF